MKILDKHEQQTIREYDYAMRRGERLLAGRIRVANPSLGAYFDLVDQERQIPAKEVNHG